MPHLSYNVKLKFALPEEKERVIATLKAERDVFNFCSERYRTNSLMVLHNDCYKEFRKLRPEVPSQVVIKGEQECLASYAAIRSNKKKLNGPAIKKRLSLRLDKRIYSLKGTSIKLTAIGGKPVKCSFIPYAKLQSLLEKHTIADPSIFERNGDIWLQLPFEVPETPLTATKALGVDLGIKRAASTSEGKIFIDRKYNAEKRQLRYLKRQLKSAFDKGSKTAKKHLRKLSRKEVNKSKNQTHLLANSILKTDANVIVLEDLSKIKSKSKGKRFNNKFSQVPVRMLRDILTYKAQMVHKTIETVPPYDTSKIDHRNNRKTGVRKGCRYYCHDGTVLDADVNAAINIGLRSRTKLPVSCGNREVFALDGQADVNRPNVNSVVCKLLSL